MSVNGKPDLDAIVEKVAALLKVEGRTPEEAAEYVRKAHELLAKYDLTMDDIGALKSDPRTAVARGAEVTRQTDGKPDGWKVDVLRAVASLYGVRIVGHRDVERTKSGKYRTFTSYVLVGFKHDVDAAHSAHTFLVEEITRLSKAYSRPMWDAIKANAKAWGVTVHEAESDFARWEGTHPLKAEVYFVKGAAQTVDGALRRAARDEREAAVAANPNAIVVQKQEVIDDFIGYEQYGDKWESVKAARAETLERWRRESAERTAREAEERASETPLERRRREAREAKEQAKEARRNARANEAYWRKQDRELARMDLNALQAGQRAGQELRISRTGIGPAEEA
jgi:hypothetical protein